MQNNLNQSNHMFYAFKKKDMLNSVQGKNANYM